MSSYFYNVCVLILLQWSLSTESSYFSMCPHTSILYMCPHTTAVVALNRVLLLLYVSSYFYTVCALILLQQSLSTESSYCSMCPHTTACVLILVYVPIRQVHLLQQSLSAECGKSQGLSHELTAVQESIKEQALASQAAVAEWKQRCTALQADMQQVALPIQEYALASTPVQLMTQPCCRHRHS